MIGVCLIDAHADLAAAWKAVIAAGCPDALVSALCAAPEPEGRMDELAAGWEDSRYRLAAVNRWSREARARYRGVAAAAKTGGRQ
jgi:hypothetical protein